MVDKSKHVELQWEKVHESFEAFSPLFNAHYKEIYSKDVDVKPEALLNLEKTGKLFLLTARSEGNPIGYYACVLTPSMYNTSIIESRDIGIYVIPERREEGITTTMQDVMDTALKLNGIKSLIVSYPKESSIPVNGGYEIKEIVYERKL